MRRQVKCKVMRFYGLFNLSRECFVEAHETRIRNNLIMWKRMRATHTYTKSTMLRTCYWAHVQHVHFLATMQCIHKSFKISLVFKERVTVALMSPLQQWRWLLQIQCLSSVTNSLENCFCELLHKSNENTLPAPPTPPFETPRRNFWFVHSNVYLIEMLPWPTAHQNFN